MAEIDSLAYWMEQLANRSISTKAHYKTYFSTFSKWMGKNPNELIEMQKLKQKQGEDPRENRVLEGKVRTFISHLEEEGYTISTRKMAYMAILSFFDNNLYPLDMSPRDRPNGEAAGSRIPEKNEIMRMLNASKSQAYRAVILLLKDSGLRVSDAIQLKWSETQDYGEGFWGWKVLTQKRKILATPFVGPEATEALKLLDRRDERVFPISASALSTAIYKIIRKTGLKKVTAHGLRKFFNVELQSGRVPREWRYAMMGKVNSPYDENRATKLFEAYREAYDHLRIYGTDANQELKKMKDDFENLREENRALRDRLNRLRDDVSELGPPEAMETYRNLSRLLEDEDTRGKFLQFLKDLK